MRSQQYTVLAITALALAVVAFVSTREHSPRAETPATTATSTIQAETDTYTIDVAYPQFGIPAADERVRQIVDKALSEFKALPPNPTPISAKNELDGRFTPISSSGDIRSVLLEIYQFTGGAHGGTTAYGLNFHGDGTEVSLEEALALIGKDLDQVSAEAKKQLNDTFGLVQFPEGAAPTKENYSTFVVRDDAVTFIFQQYQVEAYAAGMPKIIFKRIK